MASGSVEKEAPFGGIVAAGVEARGTRGGLATPHRAATEAGLDAIRSGGTAIDAALAAAVMLMVVYAHQCSIGGDAFALVSEPSGRVVAINGSGRAPRGLDASAVRVDHDRMPVTGPLSITVPGVLAAGESVHDFGGRLGLAHTLGPAIARARDGTPISRSLRMALELLGRLLDLGHGPAEAVNAARWVLGGLEVGSAEGVVRLEARIGSMRDGFEQGGFERATLAEIRRGGRPGAGDRGSGERVRVRLRPAFGRSRGCVVARARPRATPGRVMTSR